jgi:hypothetical protein
MFYFELKFVCSLHLFLLLRNVESELTTWIAELSPDDPQSEAMFFEEDEDWRTRNHSLLFELRIVTISMLNFQNLLFF